MVAFGSDFSGLTTGLTATLLGGIGAAVVAAIIGWIASDRAASIAHNTKISEFRQKWINGLRSDIAEFLGASHKWIRAWERVNDTSDQNEKQRLEESLAFPIANEARVLLWRIQLRINPLPSKSKAEDDALLESLLGLLNPGSLDPRRNPEASWLQLADDARERARRVLKREWEVAKRRS